jgi:DNA invertase Pin-like site-specific DNA recombinase
MLPLLACWQQFIATLSMLIGYARVSKLDQQDTRAQVKELKRAGCKRIFEESASGGRWDRPELHRALDQLRNGDVLVVWKLDRLSRSLKDLLHILEKVTKAKAGFRSLTEAIDTTTSAGRMMLQMLGAFAEFKRSMVRERTRLGLLAARERGRVGGRLPKLTPHQKAEVIKMVNRGDKTASEVARLFKVHRSTISRLISRELMQTAKLPANRKMQDRYGERSRSAEALVRGRRAPKKKAFVVPKSAAALC